MDANPVMIERAASRFSREIAEGRLTLLHAAIADGPGKGTFWVSDVSEWSSCNRSIASRDGAGHQAMEVAMIPLSQILSEYGVPFYLKIDIEGNDRFCVEALKGGALPRFISVESEISGDSEQLSEEQAATMLSLLRDAGYSRFKLVDQGRRWNSVRANGAVQFGMRALTSIARGRFKAGPIASLANRLTDARRIESLRYDFKPGSSGPFGDEVPGKWMSFDQARATYLRERRLSRSFGAVPKEKFRAWYDWHATW